MINGDCRLPVELLMEGSSVCVLSVFELVVLGGVMFPPVERGVSKSLCPGFEGFGWVGRWHRAGGVIPDPLVNAPV